MKLPVHMELEEKFGSRYDLVLLAAHRAKELQRGNAPLIRTYSNNPLTIALEEIAAGKYPRSEEDLRQAELAEAHDFLPELEAVPVATDEDDEASVAEAVESKDEE